MIVKVEIEWLEKMDRELDNNRVPDQEKARIAIWEWKRNSKNESFKDQENTIKIREWFDNNINHHAAKIGPEFIGCYYYDDYFWSLVIPLIYGKIEWKPHYSLISIPPRLKKQIESNSTEYEKLSRHYNNCNIYGREAKRLIACKNPSKYLISADKQLQATVSQLLNDDLSDVVLQSARMSVEMFLKSYLDMFVGLSEAKAKKLGHNLEKILNACKKLDNGTILQYLEKHFEALPNIGDRYSGKSYPRETVWRAYYAAQFTGALICRSFIVMREK